MTIGEKIEQYRKDAKLSQEELASKLFVSRQTVSQWENNQTSPTIDNLLRLCDIFSVSMNDFFGNKETASDKLAKCEEQYEWKYAEDELNIVFQTINEEDVRTFKRKVFAEVLIAIATIFFKMWSGLAIILPFLIMRIISFPATQNIYKNNCKKAIEEISNRIYIIGVEDGNIVVTITDNLGKLLHFDRIYPIYIEKKWNTENFLVIQYKQRRYIIKKNELAKESQLVCLLGL